MDRIISCARKETKLTRFNGERDSNEKKALLLNQIDIVESLFDAELRLF